MKPLYDELPRLAKRLLNKNYDVTTVKCFINVLSGEDKPANISDIREYVSDLLELRAVIDNAINTVEMPVYEHLKAGNFLKGYALTTTNRRSYVNKKAVEDLLKEANYSEDSIYKKELIGIPALEKLLKKDDVLLNKILDKQVETTSSESLKRT